MPFGPVAYPLDYAWCLGGSALIGEGTISIGDTVVTYAADSYHCTLTVETGGSLETELCVSALDGRGVELFARRTVSISGSEKFCQFEGVEMLEGPPPELNQPGALVEELPIGERFTSPAEKVNLSDFNVMVRTALLRGMGVDPGGPSMRQAKP